MSVWDWIDEFERTAHANNDRERLDILRHYHEGYHLRERDPDRAFELFSTARQRALDLDELWLALFFDEWRVTALLHFKRDHRTVLDLAVASALEARKPQYQEYPGRLGVFDNLISAYIGIDPAGHEDAVCQAMDYLDKELPDEPDSHRYLLLARRRICALELDRFQEANTWVEAELALADRDFDGQRARHFLVFVACATCQIAHAQEDAERLAEWTVTGDDLARQVGHQVELAELLSWRALVAYRDGEKEKAMRLARSAVARQKGQRMPPTRGFYEGLCAYHEATGDLQAVLGVRNRELHDVSGWGRHLSEARCRVSRLQVLARLGAVTDAEKDAARTAALRLKQPETFLATIASL